MDALTRIYDATVSDPVALLFAIVIYGWLAAALLTAGVPSMSATRPGSRLISITPNVLATLGVLGTFTGILIGLLDFNVQDIDASVPALLSGLKIAFSTSIVGMSAAIIFRFLQIFARTQQTSATVSSEDIHGALIELRDDARNHAVAQSEQLANVRKAIASEGDTRVLSERSTLSRVGWVRSVSG